MTRTTMTLSALLALVSSGLIYEVGKEDAPVEIAADVKADAVELKTADADTLKAEIESANPGGTSATCEMVTFSNYSGCYCKSGEKGGWPTDIADCKASVQISDGKVFVTDAVAKEAVVEEAIK